MKATLAKDGPVRRRLRRRAAMPDISIKIQEHR